MEEKMILHPVRKCLQKILYKRVKMQMLDKYEYKETAIAKPVMDCVYCMPSIYGTIIFTYHNFDYITTPAFYSHLVISLFCSSALAGLIYSKI